MDNAEKSLVDSRSPAMRGTPPLRLLILGVKGVTPKAARIEAGLIVGLCTGAGMVGSLGFALVGIAAAQFVPPIAGVVGSAGSLGLAFVGTAAPQLVDPIHEGRALGGGGMYFSPIA